MSVRALVGVTTPIAVALLYAGCSGTPPSESGPGEGEAGADAAIGGDVWSFGDAPSNDEPGCVHLQCNVRKDCGTAGNTTITGTVYDPAGERPLYDVYVYVPNSPLEPLKKGVTCDQCGALVSGNPITVALTGPDGKFVLENAPSGDNIPLVMQLGKWRRQITVRTVAACAETKLVNVADMRLPAKRSEGDIPQMAIVTGSFDPFECLLRKIGIDGDELTIPSKPGAVHFYRGENGTDVAGGAPDATALYDDTTTLEKYDVVILPCEALTKTAPERANIVDYAGAGGRVFTTHYGLIAWIQNGAYPFPSTATWGGGGSGSGGDIDMTFPKGQALARWLLNIGGSTSLGDIQLVDSYVYDDIAHENNPPSQRWISVGGHAKNYTFNTPADADEDKRCGRVVASDFHVSGEERVPGQKCPDCCQMKPMTPQEMALEFMLFDVSSCVLPDTKTPMPIVR